MGRTRNQDDPDARAWRRTRWHSAAPGTSRLAWSLLIAAGLLLPGALGDLPPTPLTVAVTETPDDEASPVVFKAGADHAVVYLIPNGKGSILQYQRFSDLGAIGEPVALSDPDREVRSMDAHDGIIVWVEAPPKSSDLDSLRAHWTEEDRTETLIPSGFSRIGPPAIHDGHLAWSQTEPKRIGHFMKHASIESMLAGEEGDELFQGSGIHYSTAMDDRFIVWEEGLKFHVLRAYDRIYDVQFELPVGEFFAAQPTTSGDWIAWVEYPDELYTRIRAWNPVADEERIIVADDRWNHSPAIDLPGGIIYQTTRDETTHVHYHDFFTSLTHRVAPDPRPQAAPDLFAGRAAYLQQVDGQWDVHATRVPTVPLELP